MSPDAPGDTVWVTRWLEKLATPSPPTLDEFCTGVPEADRARVRDACAAAATALEMLAPLAGGAASDLTGRRLGEFELLDVLGRGGMGVVYRARQPSLDRTVAIKVVTTGALDSTRRLERFRTEALATARVDDPRIVKVFAVGESEGVRYIAMELVDGHSLYEDFARRRGESDDGPPTLPLPGEAGSMRRIAAFFADLAEALHAAHTVGVLHRDVQPKNILIDRCGRPRVIDFGLARLLDQPSLTRSGEAAGTPFYMSPEQVRALRNEIDHRTDIYSLGAVLYEALTQVRPFEGDTSQQVMQRILRDEPMRAERRNPAVSRALGTVCGRALEKRREHRFADAGEFAAELRRVAAGESIHSIAPGPARRAARHLARRPLRWLLPVVAVLAATVAVWLTRPGAPTAVLAVTRPGHAGAEVLLQQIEPIEWRPGPAERLGTAPLEMRIPLGFYRLWLRNGDAFAELPVTATDADARIEVGAATLRTAADARTGMVEVPAGASRFGNESQGFPGRVLHVVDLAGYLIDEAEVSNAEFRAYVLATGAAPPSVWPESWETTWDPAWDDLPVPGVTQAQAQAYASWAGKRLPTEQEWERAAAGSDGGELPWRSDYDRDDVLARAVVARSPRSPAAPWQPRWESYLRGVAPVRSHPEARSALGMYHTLGNLTEWTETHMTTPGSVAPRVERTMFCMRGAAFDDDSDLVLTLRRVMYGPGFTNLEYLGFRCAKSLAPPAVAQ
ncbi:MAG: SUMF1/EgtB/PvdO family nonheme iron enzyme [Planctomycetes bacterium]|nr:SUMF1/EgtB/PvdO family nonheme iron enzyme [Planctomycetota bacterium]